MIHNHYKMVMDYVIGQHRSVSIQNTKYTFNYSCLFICIPYNQLILCMGRNSSVAAFILCCGSYYT